MKVFIIMLLLSATFFAQSQLDDTILFAPINTKVNLSLHEKVPLSMIPRIISIHKAQLFDSNIDYTNLAIVSGAALTTGIGLHIYQSNSWWKSERSNFHFENDWDYALWLDKLGHFYAGALVAHAFSSGLEAANFDSENSAILGAALSLGFLLYIEVEDGYGPNWGFSPGDAIADFLGAGYMLTQYYVPFLKNFMLKFSYYPSDKLRAGQHQGGNVIDDYEGQKQWLSIRVNEFLPSSIEKYWPDFLMLAGGVGVRNLDGSGGGQREYYIALDIDAEEIPLYGPAWQFVKNTLNYIHFPMPGFRFSPDGAFFVFCF